jgi:hypothetical protein
MLLRNVNGSVEGTSFRSTLFDNLIELKRRAPRLDARRFFDKSRRAKL